MAKKSFKDVTGIKFADLIMPLVMGGIGSYSPAAGRGVDLGLQAFRTFQAGQEFSDEREEKKAYKEWTRQQAENARAHLEQLQQEKIDTSQVATSGFHKERGPAVPVGGGEVEETPVQPGQISLFGDDGATLSDEVDLDRGGEISGAMAQDLITESLLGRKRAQDAAARDIELAQQNVRFSEAAMHTTQQTGGYMYMQDAMARTKNIDNLNFLNEQAGKWAENAAQNNEYTRNKIMLTSNERKDQMRVQRELDGRFTAHNTSQGIVLQDHDATDPNKALIFTGQDKRGGWEELMNLPIEDKIDLYNKSLAKYMAGVELSQESGEEFDASVIGSSREMLKMLWVAMQDPDDISVINQTNQQRTAQGLPPITSLRELDSMFGLGDIGTGAGSGGDPLKKFILE
jgi:hypothetical protein